MQRLVEGQPLPEANLDEGTLRRLVGYVKDQPRLVDSPTTQIAGAIELGYSLRDRTRSFTTKAGGQITRRSDRHTCYTEEIASDRKSARAGYNNKLGARTLDLRALSDTDYHMLDPEEDSSDGAVLRAIDGLRFPKTWVFETPARTIDEAFERRNLPSQLLQAFKQNEQAFVAWARETELIEPVVKSIQEEAAEAGLKVMYLSQVRSKDWRNLPDTSAQDVR